MKLRARFLLLVLVPVILVFSSIGGYAIYRFYQQQTESAMELTINLSESYAQEIEAELNKALVIAETLAVTVASQVDKGQTNRDVLNNVLHDVLEANHNLLGIWLGMEPNAYDGTDIFYMNTENHDETGRFIPYWYRGEEGLVLTHLEGYQSLGEGDYYQLALTTGKKQLLEPFYYEVGEENVFVTTIAVPIVYGTRIIGVAGVDFAVEYLQGITASLQIYENGFGRLLTETGFVVYHPDQERIGSIGEEFVAAEGQQILLDAQEDRITSMWTESISLQTDTYQTYVPIRVGDIESRWVFGGVAIQTEMFAGVMNILWRLVFVLAIGFIILGVTILAVSGTITRPIAALNAFIEKIAALDLQAKHQEIIAPYLKRNDEVGTIARAVDSMQQALIEITTQIQDISARVATRGQQIAVSVGENSAAIEEVTASMGELGSSVVMTRDRSVHMADSAKDVQDLALGGNEQMHQTLLAMEEIVKLSQESKEALATLAGQVATVEGILQIIGDVAEQTNLLALNAAIEAARAGEYGRGFAVVADEVSGLAEQTSNSVDEIRQMVRQLTDNATISTRLMDGTEEQIRVGSDLLARTEQAFNQITDRINVIGDLVRELTAALEDMNELGNSVGAAAEEQAASMGEIAQTTEDLSSLGEELQRLAQRFIV